MYYNDQVQVTGLLDTILKDLSWKDFFVIPKNHEDLASYLSMVFQINYSVSKNNFQNACNN